MTGGEMEYVIFEYFCYPFLPVAGGRIKIYEVFQYCNRQLNLKLLLCTHYFDEMFLQVYIDGEI